MKIRIKKLDKEIELPMHQREGDAALDIRSSENCIIRPGEKKLVGSGLAFEIPLGYAGLIWDRSGIASKHEVHVMAGVIDSNYRGEIKILMKNLSNKEFEIARGDRIAQMLIQPVQSVEIEETDNLSETSRNDNGFLSSGKR